MTHHNHQQHNLFHHAPTGLASNISIMNQPHHVPSSSFDYHIQSAIDPSTGLIPNDICTVTDNNNIKQRPSSSLVYFNNNNNNNNIDIPNNFNNNSNSNQFLNSNNNSFHNKRLARIFIDPETYSQMNDIDRSLLPDSFHSTMNTMPNDNNTNIYTEPTIIDTNLNSIENVPISSTAFSQIIANMNAQQTLEHLNTNLKSNEQCAVENRLLVNNVNNNSNNNNNQTTDSLTIIGQDMAITLRHGQLTQTLLNENSQNITSNKTLNGVSNPQQVLYYYSSNRMEFLPLCDLLFNIISLAAYFCDVVFDCVTTYTLYLNKQFTWFFVALFLVINATIISQILSYRWYIRDCKRERINLQKQLEQSQNIDARVSRSYSNHLLLYPDRWKDQSSNILITIHLLLCGVLWRYFKLFAPVNIATVKREVSQLCILRMIHAFCQAGPMILLQTYLVWRKPSLDLITDLNIISIFLSLFSICWALSSFNKNIRPKKIHKLVLTWFGVIFQFFWRVGTITSRIVALTVYAVLYEQWLFIVLFLHWFSMFLWLLLPNMLDIVNQQEFSWFNNNNHNNNDNNNDENNNKNKKQRIISAASLAWIYIFCFVNMEDSNSRYRMLAFYSTMFLENILLLSISMFFDNRLAIPWYRSLVIFLVLGSFLMGMFFMWIYYQYFHIKNHKNSLYTNNMADSGNVNRFHREKCANEQISTKEKSILDQIIMNQMQTFANNKDLDPKLLPFANSTIPILNCQNSSNRHPQNHYSEDSIPGVFNCRLNPALKRKKKKPSTIPPLPHLLSQEMSETRPKFKNTLESISENVCAKSITNNHHNLAKRSLESWRPGYQSKNLIHQIQRPLTNSSLLMRSYRQSPMNVAGNKANFSARSLSISPTRMMTNKFSNSKTILSNQIAKRNSPNILPTRNFTDKLDFVLNSSQHELNSNEDGGIKKKIIRPKPIVQHSINLDSISEININLDNNDNNIIEARPMPINNYGNLSNQNTNNRKEEEIYNYYEYLNSLEKSKKDSGSDNYYDAFIDKQNEQDLFMHRRPPVPGRECKTKSKDNDDHQSYIEGKQSLINYKVKTENIGSLNNITANNQMKNKPSARHSTKKRFRKSKTRIKSNQKYRSRYIDSTASSNELSSKSDFSSSGEDGDIESDVNHHQEHKFKNNNNAINLKQNLEIYESLANKDQTSNDYDRIEDYDEAFGSEENGINNENVITKTLFNDYKSIYGQIGVSTLNENGIGKYPSTSMLMKNGQTSSNQLGLNEQYRSKTVFNAAKYKRYNTPL